MSASIIWPVAAGHRHLFRVHGIMALRLFPAVVLLLYASVLAALRSSVKDAAPRPDISLKSAASSS
jgi:hypothetical protein